MPQTFQVLRCYKCEVFQVHPTNKANKWKCKMCNEKQSIKRFYGLGTGKECRLHVQKLNSIRGAINGTHCESDARDPGDDSETSEQSDQNEITSCSVAKKSKWLEYVDNEEKQQIPDEPTFLNNTEVVLELPTKHPNKSYTLRAQTKPKPKTEDLSENYSHPSTFSNNYKRPNVIKSIDEKSVMNSCFVNGVNADNEVLAPPVVNSKWAKFTDTTQNCKDENILDPISVTANLSALNPSFQFLEEEDLDSVLDL